MNLIKNTKNLASKVLSGFLLFLVFLSFNAYSSDPDFSHKPTPVQLKNNLPGQIVNYYTSADADSKLSPEREENKKNKKFNGICFTITTMWNISHQTGLFSAQDPFLLKTYLALEILSSRNHPPTNI